MHRLLTLLLLFLVPMSKGSTDDGGKDKAEPRAAEPADDGREVPIPDLAGRAEQLGAIIVKTLDLAEAGLSLGLTVLTRAGAVAQGALTDRLPGDLDTAPEHSPAPAANHHPPQPPPPPEAPEEEPFYLANRLPLEPGGAVQVSFSITNDSLIDPKRVTLRVEPLVGELHGVRIDAAVLAVRPARKTIPPMDFEKFVLTGTLPAAAPADVYRGAVIVHSTDEMSIPVRLEVAVH